MDAEHATQDYDLSLSMATSTCRTMTLCELIARLNAGKLDVPPVMCVVPMFL
jgi:hypothetical protein